MLDIRVINGQALDGLGNPATRLDVGVLGDRIEAVGDLSGAEARETVDARGKIVCPGFVDAHSHSDTYLLIEPSAPSKIFQGITTEVVGNCGASAAPRVGAYRPPADWQDKVYPRTWSTVAEYRQTLAQVGPATNVVLLVGHSNLRAGVVGYDNRAATPDEMRAMTRWLEQSIDEGARGFSTGLIYPPGLFAGSGEVAELAAVAGRRGGVYASHLRNEGTKLIEALEEFFAAGRSGGARLQVSHLKTSGGPESWALIDRALESIRRAQADGLCVTADRYPYTSGWTDLDVVLPTWAKEGGRDAILARLRNPASRDRLREELTASRPEEAWGGVTIGSVAVVEFRHFQGCGVLAAAQELQCSPVDAILRILDKDELHTGAFFAGMSKDNMIRILAEPYVMIGTDSSLRALTGPLSRDFPHPRAYGTFPCFLRMSLDGKTVSLPEAIRKTTSLPARQFGLDDRGSIVKDMKADLIVFDPKTIRDTATYAKPHQLAVGIDHVIVNGVPTLRNGRLTGQRGGRFL